MVKFLGLTAVGWTVMTGDWWDKLLAVLLLSSIILGSVLLIFLICRKINKNWQRRQKVSKVSTGIAKYFVDVKSDIQHNCPQRDPAKLPKSFGVFLGCFSHPPTPGQARLLSQWDLLVLDPLQRGVLDAISSPETSSQILGRLDVSSVVKADRSCSDGEVIRSLRVIYQTLVASFKRPDNLRSPFTGVLLAKWQKHFQPVVFNELVKHVNNIGLEVYLELSSPDFLTEEECRGIDLSLTKGIICRNGSILPNGDRRNYFQMAELRRAQRAAARQPNNRGSNFLIWETLDDDVVVSHAVVKRSFNWCRFNNAFSWIGSRAALTNADLAATETVAGEPLGALMWLKEESVLKSHDAWRLNDTVCRSPSGHHDIYESLHSFVPDLKVKLSPLPRSEHIEADNRVATIKDNLGWAPRADQVQKDPFSYSFRGQNYAGLGCFQLGLDCSSKDFDDLVEQQRNLRDLGLLKLVKSDELRRLGDQLHILITSNEQSHTLHKAFSSPAVASRVSVAIKELQHLVSQSYDDENKNGCFRVYMGLQSGFRTSLDTVFWGLHDTDSCPTDIYVSAKTRDLAGTVLHTFLSSKGMTRAQCFMAEMVLSEQTHSLTERWNLPLRFVQDIELLSPAETILFLQRLVFSPGEDYAIIAARMRSLCKYQLIEVPTLAQLRASNSTAYLQGEISAEDLVTARLSFYRERGCQHPDPSTAISLFKEVDIRLQEILMERQSQLLSQLESVLRTVLQEAPLDASADLFALSVFCACRKLAISEIYLEILDRNPLPNAHPDQAACYAEMFATGSRCDSYFDMTPNELGKILSDRYHAYYKVHQPPMRDDNATELPTTYASKLVDLDPDAGPEKLPTYYQITFLGIFAVPALIDILLLTTIGRGLYLTAFMSEDEKHMATTALMLALLLCGAIGTWIGSGGSYYLHSMAFPAMNMFVLTRFIAGIAVCFASGAVALITIALVKGAYAGIIFLLYFVILTTYFSLLAALAIYQLPGFMFQSGRMVILSCIPILFISPLLTLWIGHDVLVYLCVLGSFITALLFGARSVISQWGSWYLKITCISDNDVLQWYIKPASSKPALHGTADIAAASRQALRDAVLRERNRRIWTKPTGDELVRKLSAEHLATNLLMTWYCKYTRTKMPLAYSPTWNLQCNAGLDTLREMQKGLKLHNAFVHWRHAGDEVYCGILYFVIALMDKWVALISGGSIVGLSAANSATYRLAVGFSLASYLISAVFLDGIASPLWATANKKTPRPVRSLQYLRQVASADAKARRILYWTTLCKFFLMHFYGVAITACLMWTFEESRSAVYMYLAYMTAYAGLLWYQFNRIFTGTRALNDLLIAAALGLLIGPLLRHFLPQFDFSSVIALAVSTWTVAMLSIYTANVWWPRFKDDKRDNNKTETPIFHCSSTLEHHQQHSQSALSEIYQSISAIDTELRNRINPSEYPGVQIIQQLKDDGIKHRSKLVRDAFPSARHLLLRTAELFKSGEVIVDIVPARHLFQINPKMRSISRNACGRLHVFLLTNHDLKMDIDSLSKFAAAALVQATTEVRLGLSHDHSILAEVLTSNDNEREELLLPEGVKCQLETSASERAKVLKNRNKALLHYLLLGLDCDIDWDRLPETARCFLLRRCCGEPCYLSGSQVEWVRKDSALDIEQYMARCNLGVNYSDLLTSFAEALESDYLHRDSPELSGYPYMYSAEPAALSCEKFLDGPASSGSGGPLSWSTLMRVTSPSLFFARIYHALRVCTKFLAVSLVADPEFQRELDYLMSFQPRFVRWPVKCVLNGIWIFCKTLQQLILPIFLFHGREEVSKLYNNMKGIKTVMKKDRIIIESLSGLSTCFLGEQPDGSSQLHQYSGSHTQEPSNPETLMAINTYTERLVLRQRQEFAMKKVVGLFTYEYTDQPHTRLPIQRQCIKGDLSKRVVQYDSRGYVTSGSYVEDGNLVEFKWSYRKNAKFDDELLRAEYVLAHIRIEVSWCVPPPKNAEKLDRWLPNSKVMEATYIQDSEVYRSKWSYDHRSHPVIETTLNDQPVATPPMIQYDWFHVLTKPKQCNFLRENPLVSFSSGRTSFLSRMLGFTTHRHRISTSSARTHLWKSWKNSKSLDAVTARWLDDHALRSDRILRPYWRARDTGRLKAAKSYLDAQADTLMARTDIDPEVSSWTLLAYKISDFYSFGQGGDATINTRTQSTQMRDSHDTLHVLAHDTGTWPNEGGGVSACRRDMVNDLRSIRWHVLAENANDFGLPKFQIEKNVQSLTVLPLWGLDFLTPTHGIFENHLDSAVQQRSHNSTPADIRRNFFPILNTLVRCSRAINLRKDHLEDAAKALVDLNAYFQSSRHWSDVWMSDTVKEQWQELWLTEDADNQRPISEWLLAEHPTLSHLDQALDMWHRYLFIFSIPVPEKIPDVFQASHHFAGASYGVLCKLLRKCTLHVWDHCISWREVTVFLSSAMSFDPPFVCTSLMGLSRLTTSLILTHADVVLPCADFFNPGWEVELGTIGGTLGHRRTFARKIDPVINGIADMERFNPIEKIKSDKPTVSMLSHVRFVKDIKNAILAADIIVNEWGFEDYRLEIYGDMIRAPSYSVECQEIVAAKSLGKHVLLKGLGSPAKVLERAWIFLNCSVSEGLPLAMGEASLTGVPVVCTDVGASFRVVTDPETGKKFSAVVAPNDSLSLAKAQINVLALLDEWSQFAGDEEGYHPKLPFQPTREDAKQITKRMYEKNEQRRALGMMGRANVLNSFSSDRYLREHEQMLWIGKYRSRSYNDRMSQSTSYNSSRLALSNMRVTVLPSESSRQSFFT